MCESCRFVLFCFKFKFIHIIRRWQRDKENEYIRVGCARVSDVHNKYCEGHSRTNAHLYEFCAHSLLCARGNQPTYQPGLPTKSTHSITSKSYVMIWTEQQNEMKLNEMRSLTPFKPFQSYHMNFLPKNHPSDASYLCTLALYLSPLVNLIRSISIFTNEMSFSYNIYFVVFSSLKVAVLFSFVIFLMCAMTLNKNSLGVAYINSFEIPVRRLRKKNTEAMKIKHTNAHT